MRSKISGLHKFNRELNEQFPFFNSSSDGYVTLDSSFNIITANQTFLSYLKVTLKNIIGVNIKKLFAEYTIEGLYSERYLFNTTSIRIKETDYFVVKLQFAKDFEKEKSSNASDKFLSKMINAENILSMLTEVCFKLDINFNIIYVNSRAYETWNKSENEIIGHNIFEILDNVYSPIKQFLDSALSYKHKIFKEVFLEKIGRWILLSVNPEDTGIVVLHSDVTEKIKYRENLQQKELQLKTLIDNVPDLVTRWSGDANLLFANTSFFKKKINSFKKSDFNQTENKNPGVVNWENKIRTAYKTGKTLSHDIILSTQNGDAYLESSIIPEKNLEGKVESVLAISRDVTEKKIADKKIIDAKNFLQSVFDASVNGIIAFESVKDESNNTVDFKCILSNNSSVKILGYNPINYNLSSVIRKRNAKPYFSRFNTLLEKGLRIEEEFFYSYKSSKVWLHLVAEKLNNGVLVTFSDITKRKEAERKNIKTLALLQNLINGSPVVLVHYKIEKDKHNNIVDFTILNSNLNASSLLGMSVEQLKGKRLLEIMPSVFNHELGDNLKNFVVYNNPNRFETYYNKDGLDNWWDISLVKESGGIILTAINITEKVESERKIKELQNIQQAKVLNAVMQTQEEERRRVAESLHNDFGQLLNIAVIKLGKDNKEVSEILNESIKKMRSISYELMPPMLKDYGLEVAIMDMLSTKSSSSNINITYSINGLKTVIEKDLEVAIYRITQELLNNAIKHSGAKEITIVISNNRKKTTISINDNGKGFDIKTHQKKFGLKYITDRINLLNGTFKITTKKGLGTKCFIEIPSKHIPID